MHPETASQTPSAYPAPNRILTLDILRGLALMGIFIVHGVSSSCGWYYLSIVEKAAVPFPEANRMVYTIVSFLLSDKSRTLFALMFGISFFLQLQAATQQNRPFIGDFLRRLAILLIFGLLHGHLLFGGDILRYYAIGGIFLVLAYRWSTGPLIGVGLLLTVLVPLITYLSIGLFSIQIDASEWATFGKGFTSQSFFDNLYTTHRTAVWRYHWYLLANYMVPVVGTFLFGIWIARSEYIQQAFRFKNQLKRLFWWGLGIGIPGQLGLYKVTMLIEQKAMVAGPLVLLANQFIAQVNTLAMSLAYVTGITLLCLHPAWLKRLAILIPAGRMTLTNYVMQSILTWLIYYGSAFGLFGKVGPAIALAITLVLCVFQLVFSTLWLKRFQFGPLEWCWRRAVQGKRPQLRREAPLIS